MRFPRIYSLSPRNHKAAEEFLQTFFFAWLFSLLGLAVIPAQPVGQPLECLWCRGMHVYILYRQQPSSLLMAFVVSQLILLHSSVTLSLDLLAGEKDRMHGHHTLAWRSCYKSVRNKH